MELKVVGKSVPRVDALEKVTGKAKYRADRKYAGMCYAKLVRSPYPNAKILRIDTSAAQKVPGVRAVVTGKDLPDRRAGEMIKDQYPLARDVARFAGDPVAAVVADTIDSAETALELIEVEYEELPGVFDVEEAFQANPPAVVHPDRDKYERRKLMGTEAKWPENRPNILYYHRIRSGDVEKGFKRSDLIIENRYYIPKVHHCQLEPHGADAWVEPDGTLVVVANKGIWRLIPVLSGYFNIPPSKIRMLHNYMGGEFGGKGSMTEALIAAALAVKTKRPIRLVYSRAEVFTSAGSRERDVVYIKDGVKKDGTLVAREITILADSGAYSEKMPMVTRLQSYGAVPTYRVPNFKLDSYGIYTNTATSRSFRGLGTSQPIWAIEQQMDIIADKLGIDPVELRRRNVLSEGEPNVCSEITHSCGARECLEKAAQAIEWGKPSAPSAGPWKKGKGIGIGNKFTGAPTTSVAIVKVHPDGTVEVRHTAGETGQGSHTVIAQFAAEEFGVSPDKIKLVFGDTFVTPYDFGSGSSRQTFHTGLAVQRACRDAKRQLFQLASVRLGKPPEDMAICDGKIYVPGHPGKEIAVSGLFSSLGYEETLGEIIGRGIYTAPYVQEDENGQSPRPVAYYVHGANAVEVAVNTETGEVKVLKAVGAFDMGFPINPKMCEQQIEGGMAMGLGNALFEEMKLDRGVLINPSFADYKLPTCMEIPSGQQMTSILAPAPHREGPYGAKGLGEGVLTPMVPAVTNAIFNAVGVRIYDLPLTREKILKALKENSAERKSGKIVKASRQGGSK